jgi:bifunctional DNase/RNase
MTPMRVLGVHQDPASREPIVLLEDANGTFGLAFFVPTDEANRLARALGMTPCPCVPVFDLVEQLLADFGARVVRVVLDHAERGIWSRLHIRTRDGEVVRPCHPADALALARRTGAPIYATEDALRHGCRLDRSCPHGPDRRAVATWLERVRPEDFEG